MDILRGLIAYAISAVTGKPRPLSTNAADELLVSIASSVATQDVNVIKVLGVATPAPNVAGTMPVENDHYSVNGVAIPATSVAGTFPVETDHRHVLGVDIPSTVVGGKFPVETDHRTVAGTNIAATTLAGTFPVETDHRKVAGSAMAATTLAGTLPVETDHRKVAGSAMAATTLAGTLPCEDDIRKVNGVAVAATSIAGKLPVEADIRQIGGNNVASIGVNGGMFVGGDVADDVASSASNPIKLGAVADEIESAVADDDQVHLITDLYRRLKIVSAAYDSLTESDSVTNLNTTATDMDTTHQIDADVTDVAVATYIYPSAAGRNYGTRNKRTWTLVLDEVTSCALYESDDDFATEVDVTASLVDRALGTFGHAAAHFTATGAAVTFKVQMDQPSASKAYRWKVVAAGAGTNDILIITFGRAN